MASQDATTEIEPETRYRSRAYAEVVAEATRQLVNLATPKVEAGWTPEAALANFEGHVSGDFIKFYDEGHAVAFEEYGDRPYEEWPGLERADLLARIESCTEHGPGVAYGAAFALCEAVVFHDAVQDALVHLPDGDAWEAAKTLSFTDSLATADLALTEWGHTAILTPRSRLLYEHDGVTPRLLQSDPRPEDTSLETLRSYLRMYAMPGPL